MNSSTEHLAPSPNSHQLYEWTSTSSTLATSTPTMESPDRPDRPQRSSEKYIESPPLWNHPPIPPIPNEGEGEAWRRRSMKRQSYTSQMSVRSTLTGTGTIVHQNAVMGKDGETAVLVPTRPVSAVSVRSTGGAGRSRRTSRRRAEDDAYGDLHWEISPLNPRNWRRRRKWVCMTVVGGMTFVITFASSVLALAEHELMANLRISRTIAILTYALFLLGLAFGPTLSRPSSKLVGRRIALPLFFVLFAIFTLASAFMKNIVGLTVCRALAGIFAGPILALDTATLINLWIEERRSVPSALYYIATILGPAVGVLTGGFVTETKGWQWTQYTVLFACAACIVPVALVPETSKATILRLNSKSSSRDPSNEHGILQPFRALFTKPTLLLLSLYSALNTSFLYATFLALPRIFGTAHSFSLGFQGLTCASTLIGGALGLTIHLFYNAYVYTPKLSSFHATQAAEAEKAHHRSHRPQSNLSRPSLSRRQSSRPSTALSLKRVATATSTASTAVPVDVEKNTHLAKAAANYLNGLPPNTGRRIMPERIVLILNKNPAYGDLCEALEGFQLKLDRVALAKVLLDALQSSTFTPSKAGEVEDGDAKDEQSNLVRSKSLHRSAAAAALNNARPPPRQQRSTRVAETPPAVWRLHVALPASVILSASLFFLGWTARKEIHWVVPCVAMGLFVCAAFLVLVSVEMYLMERHSAAAVDGSLILRYLLSFGFAMAAEPMYERLGAGWAMSVFGLISVLFGTAVWVPVLRRGRRK